MRRARKAVKNIKTVNQLWHFGRIFFTFGISNF